MTLELDTGHTVDFFNRKIEIQYHTVIFTSKMCHNA